MSAAPRLSRRSFLGAAGVVAAPLVLPGRVLGLDRSVAAPSERVRVAIVGAGVRGKQLAHDLPSTAELVAVADANLPRAEALAGLRSTGATRVAAVADYRTLLDRADLDALIVTATDQHHAHAGVLACVAGLDAYVEKPLTTYFAEGRALVNAARKHDRVVQTGTQQRTMERNRYACELVRDGGIGEVKVVECVNYSTARPYPPEGLPEEAVPAGLDWDLWLGPAPLRAYNERLAAHWTDNRGGWWGDWREYSAGGIAGMGAHALDMVQYALGADDSGPVEFVPLAADEVGTPRVDFKYANGVEVRLRFLDARPYRGPRLGAVFAGTDGKIEINRNRFRSNPPELTRDGPDPALAAKWDGDGWVARGHVEDWIDAIKTRRRPNADVEIGHRTATVYHLVSITRAVNRPVRWDPATETILGDPQASAMLDQPRRAGWELPG
ncbi:MAG: Gfo/Idh/MocA family protein [Lacipirellulaceae bacterium]